MTLHKSISTVPSEAIHQALDDLIELSRTPGCEIDMGHWFQYEADTAVCSMCLGGAVMASIVDACSDYRYMLTGAMSPDDLREEGLISHDQRDIIVAMDDIRGDMPSEIKMGLRQMNVPEHVIAEVIDCEYESYDRQPEIFISQRRELANALKVHGY